MILPPRPVDFDASGEPYRVAIFVGHGAAAGAFANEATTVIVEPVKVLAVFATPGEVGGAGMLDQAAVGVAHVLRRVPGVPAVAAVGIGRVTVDGAVDAEEGPVTEDREALLFGDWATAGWSAQSDVTVGQRLPADLLRGALGKDVVAAQEGAF